MRFTENGETVLQSPAEYIAAYEDYWNDFLTVDRFAIHYGWSVETARQVISEGRDLREQRYNLLRMWDIAKKVYQ